jgi:hypothetical protein
MNLSKEMKFKIFRSPKQNSLSNTNCSSKKSQFSRSTVFYKENRRQSNLKSSHKSDNRVGQ